MGNAMMKKKTKTNLPEELVVEILLNLSVKSLLRCRCVCKSLYNLIKSPNFVKLHLIKNQNHDYIILIRRLLDSKTSSDPFLLPNISFHDYVSLDVIAPDLEIPQLVHDYNLVVCGPCNGLICISALNKTVVCNPSLREFKEIPHPHFTCPEGYKFSGTQMFSKGLGFDSNTNDYKVIAFIRLIAMSNLKIQCRCLMYNVGISTWLEIDHEQGPDMSHIEPLSSSSGVLSHGALHWIAKGLDISLREETFILRFDTSTEVFGYMTLPNIVPKAFISFVALNDSLAIFSHDLNAKRVIFEIWVMKQYGVAASWTKQSRVGPMMCITAPLLVWKNEKVLLSSINLLRHDERHLISCGFDTDDYAGYAIFSYQDKFRVLVNQESLVSIK